MTDNAVEGQPVQVFLVTEGDYSDYRVVGAFSTLALAREFKRLLGGDELNENIEEMELDANLPQLRSGLRAWTVWMRRDGSNESVRDTGVEMDNPKPKIVNNSARNVMIQTVWATNAEHASKIVNERRVQMIANGEWEDK